ncbi:hypothetical protein AB4P17_09825 [Escherichia coli]|uniref:hypothetical protein n=1 Tax=Escherichia coli TaxID=562 RepID=UPI0034C5CAAC
MSAANLPACPQCGNRPEYAFKIDYQGWHRGGLKCPYDHHRVSLNGPAGSRKRAIEILAPQWCELVAKIQGETE